MKKEIRTIYLLICGSPNTTVADSRKDIKDAVYLMKKYSAKRSIDKIVKDWIWWLAL